MRIYDVSMPLHKGMLIYPGTDAPAVERYRHMASGDSSNNSRFAMGCHVGTHVDAPCHYVDGAPTIDTIAPELLVGPARVFDLGVTEAITADALAPLEWDGVTKALLRTTNSPRLSEPTFNPAFIYVDGSAAEFLVARGVRLVGVDYLSVDQYHSPTHPAHLALLGSGVVVIEGLDLSGVPAGDYTLVATPLKLVGAEAAPARVFLMG
jgi:arylformamidase